MATKSALIGIAEEPVVIVLLPKPANIGEKIKAHGVDYEIYFADEVKNENQLQNVYLAKY